MNNTHLRLYIVADEKLEPRIDTLKQALDILRQDYEVVEGLTLSYELVFRSFDNVPWEDYWGDGKSFGLSIEWVGKEHAKVKSKYGEKFASVIYVVAPENWKPEHIGGWNLGRFFSGMSAQICKGYMTVLSMHLVLSMELAHALNEQVYRELGLRLKDSFPEVDNWDYDIIHGEHKDFVMFQYKSVFQKIADILLRTFKKKEARFMGELKAKVVLLARIVDLYRQVIIMLGKIESPFNFGHREMPIYDEEIQVEKVVK